MLYDSPDYHELSPVVLVPVRPSDTRFSTVVSGTPHSYMLILNCYETDRMDRGGSALVATKTVSFLHTTQLLWRPNV